MLAGRLRSTRRCAPVLAQVSPRSHCPPPRRLQAQLAQVKPFQRALVRLVCPGAALESCSLEAALAAFQRAMELNPGRLVSRLAGCTPSLRHPLPLDAVCVCKRTAFVWRCVGCVVALQHGVRLGDCLESCVQAHLPAAIRRTARRCIAWRRARCCWSWGGGRRRRR